MTFYGTQAGTPNNNFYNQAFEHSPPERQANDIVMLRNDGRKLLLANGYVATRAESFAVEEKHSSIL